ncbi:OprO/OprP family phosphate-selective porin [uncultured Castellaniella sp.]|uniref:OprO/OprP family phosphate-selective porin n=1 Tax=uncultured Castellaniella sp. TaxID=647907 RepID=UPI00261C172C|nr:OprO/OprP family phosphate-selective porin [uncultured Castellaniella sp.]
MKKGLLFFIAALCLGATQRAGAVEVNLGGRLHLDYAASQADARAIDKHFLVRRAKLGLDGRFNEDWSFEVAYDFADVFDATEDGIYKGDNKFRNGFDDIVLQYDGWRFADLAFGQFKVPFGLEELTSSNNISFIERALPSDAFGPSRRVGIGLNSSHDHYTVAAMGFGKSFSDDDRGHGVAARFTYAPINTPARLLHFGVAGVIERPRGDVKFSTRPESKASDIRLVSTGDLDDVHRIDRIGLEAAWRSGPFSVQAEWMRAAVGRDDGRADAHLQGWYVMGSWVLTGESREYKNGRFKGVSAGRPGGAWELTTRYSNVDLDDADVRGGAEENFALGLNYYVNRHLRIMANYIKARSERKGKSDSPDILLVRMQLAF